ncbi:MAG: hypothetical protein RBT20_04510, partial [Syntrophales bacterium]|nr:hypothetical protein [Syntrophales bacterium]
MRELRRVAGREFAAIRRRGTARRSSFLLFLSALLYLWSSVSVSALVIEDYRPCFHAYQESDGTLRVAWRQFQENGTPYFLVLDPVRMEVEKVNRPAIEGKPAAGRRWDVTPFARALAKYTAPPQPLRNAGLRRAEGPARGYCRTVARCPCRTP